MQTLAIEINDAGLVVADEQGVLAVEPGYALIEGGVITTGARAHRQARLKPRHVSNRYWANLGVEPGSAGVGEASAAELAYAQLDALWREYRERASRVVLVVPSGYRREQLGLLLGLAEEVEMPVHALVHVAVAASTRPYPGRQVVHVDAGLHRVAATQVEQADEAIVGDEQALDATGLVTVNDLLARWIAEAFVLTTRFDPFHHADTEQQLYDGLPSWLAELDGTEAAEVALEHAGETFAVTIERERLRGVLAGFNRAVMQLIAQTRDASAGIVVQLSDRLAGLPGLERELGRLDDAEIVQLPVGQAAVAALHGVNGMALSAQSVRLLKHMPWRERLPAEVAGDAPATADARAGGNAPARGDAQADGNERVSGNDRAVGDERAVGNEQAGGHEQAGSAARSGSDAHAVATHLVYRGYVRGVPAAGLVIGREPPEGRRGIVIDDAHGGVSREHAVVRLRHGELYLEDTSRYGTFVNERRVDGEWRLEPGDVIRVGTPGAELHVVAWVDDDGP